MITSSILCEVVSLVVFLPLLVVACEILLLLLRSLPLLPLLLSLFLLGELARSALAMFDLRVLDEDDEPFLIVFKCSGILVCLCFLGGCAAELMPLLATADEAGIVMNRWTTTCG